ncbi:nucleic acid-binding protein [Halobacteriales archaeon QS_9_70_65]|nr:MAG: nucleic acid-binding protein [Halobacteriales archaeon QS_9_70_65]
MSRLVVTDAGPLIHLEQADALSLLELTGEVLVPKTVLDELEDGPTDISELEFSVGGADIDVDSVYPHLDPGETAAILACTERDAILLTDDMDARDTANEEGIEVHGSVGVVLYGYGQGVLTEDTAKRTLRELKQDTSLYLSTPLIEHAIELVVSGDAGW